MSASESEHGKLDEDRFEISEERVRTDGPVSLRQLKQELKNEKRYDDFTDPEDVFLDDFSDLEDAFYELREGTGTMNLMERSQRVLTQANLT